MREGVKGIESESFSREYKFGERCVAQAPRQFEGDPVGRRQDPASDASDESAGSENDHAPARARGLHDLADRALDARSKCGPALESCSMGRKTLPVQEQ